MTPEKEKEIEIELNRVMCAEVALYMFKQYQESMSKTRFSVPTFRDWLLALIKGKI